MTSKCSSMYQTYCTAEQSQMMWKNPFVAPFGKPLVGAASAKGGRVALVSPSSDLS